MKHQSYYDEYKKLHAKDIAELRRCLEVHGGEYDWNAPEHEDECCPIITVGLDYYVGDVDVKRIWIDERDKIKVYADEHDGWADMEFDIDDVHFSHVEYIMDYMVEKLSEEEKHLIAKAVTDLETGNHLLYARTPAEKQMINEVLLATNTHESERTDRQNLIYEEYMRCTDPDYEPKTEET